LARRKKKKDKKKHLKEEKFRDTMLEIGKWVKEYRYPLLLGIAVVAILFVLLSMRRERQETLLTYAHNVLKKGSVVGPKELKDLAQKVSGDPIEPWVLLRLGTTLFDLYQKEDALTGDKGRLEEAKKTYQDVVARFPENGSAVYVAKRALKEIDEELQYEPADAVKDAFEGTGPAPRPTVRPRRAPPRAAAQRKPPQIKKPKITPGKPAPGKKAVPAKKPVPAGKPEPVKKPEPAPKTPPEQKPASGENKDSRPPQQKPASGENKQSEPSGQPGTSEPRKEKQ
jgi:hypothetical protein